MKLACWTGCGFRNGEWGVYDRLIDAISAKGVSAGAVYGFQEAVVK